MLTSDSLFDGELTVYQEKDGYRFSIDAVLLAGLTRVRASDKVIDLGTGCGVIPLILNHRKRGASYVGLEIQSELVALARKNIEINSLTDRIKILQMDFREASDHFRPESFDLLMSNPPYRRVHTGRINPNRQRAVARHEIAGSVAEVFAAGKFLLPTGGRLAVIYPASRLIYLLRVAHRFGFSPQRLVIIHSDASSPAKLVHLESRKDGGDELLIEAPFCIYQDDGSYSKTMLKLYKK